MVRRNAKKKLCCGDCEYLRNRSEYRLKDLPQKAPCMIWEDEGLPEVTEDSKACEQFTEAEETRVCGACNGSGEGRYDGSRCSTCRGSGEVPSAWGEELLENARDAEADAKYDAWKEREMFGPPRRYDDERDY